MKISQKNKNTIKLENDDKTIDNTLELIQSATEVKSRINTDINSDYVLSVLDDKDKKAIIEMTNNAYLSKRIVTNITTKKVWKWNKNTKKWEHKDLDQETKDKILKIADEIFDIHMIRHEMKVIMERNKKDNPILNGLLKTQPTNPEEITPEQEETIAQKILTKFKKKQETEE